MPKPFKYLSHQLTGTNQHGIHSPFVYDYVTKCLYKKTKFKGSKSREVLLKSILYFKIASVKLIPDNGKLQQKIQEEAGICFHENTPFDLIYIENPSEEIKLEDDEVHNHTMIFVEDIHKNEDSERAWNQLKSDQKITVSIDLFYCGLLFFRKEQVKEHFKIRI